MLSKYLQSKWIHIRDRQSYRVKSTCHCYWDSRAVLVRQALSIAPPANLMNAGFLLCDWKVLFFQYKSNSNTIILQRYYDSKPLTPRLPPYPWTPSSFHAHSHTDFMAHCLQLPASKCQLTQYLWFIFSSHHIWTLAKPDHTRSKLSAFSMLYLSC